LRRPDRFELLLEACASDFHGRTGFEARPYARHRCCAQGIEAARSVDAGVIARGQTEPAKIAAAVHEARVHAVKQALGKL
jgi:tRNA nucleotidyltransferase (CCA-adding enzyme)